MHTVKPKYIKCMSEILETRKGECEREKHRFAIFSFGETNSDGKMELPCMGIFYLQGLEKCASSVSFLETWRWYTSGYVGERASGQREGSARWRPVNMAWEHSEDADASCPPWSPWPQSPWVRLAETLLVGKDAEGTVKELVFRFGDEWFGM